MGDRHHDWVAPRGKLQNKGLRVRTLGSGEKGILLLHGLVSSNRYVGAAFDELASGARLMIPDLLGFGESPKPEDSAYDLDAHVEALCGMLDALQVTTPSLLALTHLEAW